MSDWKIHGKGAGPIRNGVMLAEGKPQGAVAFDLGTRGTADMKRKALASGLRVIVYTSTGREYL